MSPTILSNIYHLVKQFNDEKQEKRRQETVRRTSRQDSIFSTSNLVGPLVVFASVLSLQTASLYLDSQSQYKLENDPQCGLTTGGMVECTWDCDVSFGVFGQEITNPECLRDCFEDTPCVGLLLDDPECSQQATIDALIEPSCIQAVYSQQPLVYSTLSNIMNNGNCFGTAAEEEWFCFQVVEIFANFETIQDCKDFWFSDYDYSGDYLRTMRKSIKKSEKNFTNSSSTRLPPVFQTIDLTTGGSIRTEVPFENTRNRYPWICSLRSREYDLEHYCAVTLLRRPPGPTVLVGAAHCTYLCKKSETTVVSACCCADGPESCADDTSKCGTDPKVYEMTGADAEIVCGEWETGSIPFSQSGEQFNIILPINEIVRHPNFDTSQGAGPGTGSDIAIFKVNDQYLTSDRYSLINPTCLPQSTANPSVGSTAVHSGWSRPPSLSFLREFAPPYIQYYRDFLKQWHLKMEIAECRDPLINPVNGDNLIYPTDTSYPAGTVCAKEFTRLSCFTTGDSGSPLMIKQSDTRYYTEGILSFIKGCDVFSFGVGASEKRYFLNQQSQNPSVYAKLSCFLPWIALQYGLQYDGVVGDECSTTQPSNKQASGECRNTPSNLLEAVQNLELPCLFPFYLDGKKYESCVLFDQNDFVLPVFRCPIRNITTKIDGINSFRSDDLQSILTGGLCQDIDAQKPDDLLPPITPELLEDCSSTTRRVPFSQCKNDCPGVRAFGVIGGGAALAFLGATAGQALLQAGVLGGLGIAGAAGVGVMMSGGCPGPIMCTAQSGQCCTVTIFGCPASC